MSLSSTHSLRRITILPSPLPKIQCRNATLLRRPKRPYMFTQLVTLSDGSAYTQRTTSPAPVYKTTKDTRNTPLWNPSSQKLLGRETDEAGKLKAFRAKFGRGWDASRGEKEDSDTAAGETNESGDDSGTVAEVRDDLADLITGYGRGNEQEETSIQVPESDTDSEDAKDWKGKPKYKGKAKKMGKPMK